MAELPEKFQTYYNALYPPLVAWFQSQKETQAEIYKIYSETEKFKFYDMSDMTPWIKMADKLSTNIGKTNKGKALEDSIDLFFSKMVVAIGKLPPLQKKQFIVFPKSYAAIGYLTRDFYLSLLSLVTLVAISKNPYDYIALLRLCVQLKEWDILRYFLEKDVILGADMVPAKNLCRLYREFYTCNDVNRQFEIADEVITIRDELADGRSYGYYWALQTIYNLLACASKLPQADIEKYECPVSNSYSEKQKCMSPLASRLPTFFKYHIQCITFDFEEVPEDDSLLKMSIALSDFCESMYTHSEALMDAGLIKDAAEELLLLGFLSLRSAMLTRVIISMSTLYYVKLRTDYDRDKLKGIGAMLALFLTPTTGQKALKLRDDLVNDIYLFRKRNDSDSVVYANEADSGFRYKMVRHREECSCDFCVMKEKNFSLNVQAGFAEAMIQKMPMSAYNDFMSTLNNAYTVLDKRRAIAMNVIKNRYHTSVIKTKRIFEIGRRYCLATYVCLQFNTTTKKSTTQLCQGMVKWSNYFVELRFYWLFGRQALRTPCNLEAYPWLEIPRTLADDSDDSTGKGSLFQCFRGFTRRPKKPLRFELSPTRIPRTDQRVQLNCQMLKKLNLNDDGPVYVEDDGSDVSEDITQSTCPTTPIHTPRRVGSPEPVTPISTPKTALERPTARTPSKKAATPVKSKATPPSTPVTTRTTRSQAAAQPPVLNFDELTAATPPTTPSTLPSAPQTPQRTPTRRIPLPENSPSRINGDVLSEEPARPEPDAEVAEEAEEVNNARGDFKKFSHLFYSDWRPVICLYIGAFLAEPFPWHAAYYFAESLATPLRSLKRRHEKQPEELRFECTAALKEFVRSLPPAINIVNLIVDPRNVLWLVRMCSEDAPIILPVAKVNQPGDVISSRLFEIMANNDSSVNVREAEEFWRVRDALDRDLKQVLINLEKTWLLSFKVLMVPFTHTASSLAQNNDFKAIASKLKGAGFTEPRAQFLAELFLNTKEVDFRAMLNVFIYLDRADIKKKYYESDGQKSLYNSLLSYAKKMNLKKPAIVDDKFTIVMLSPELSPYPWEVLPVFDEYPMVMRCQSIHFFKLLIEAAGTLPKIVDASKLYYVINPGNDLEKTENRMREALKLEHFPGVVRGPPENGIADILHEYELLCYVGHGSGSSIFGTKRIRNSICNAATILMGCSSARIEQEGRFYDGKGAVHDYAVAGSPFVMGCLWMVTDGEIDKYFVALMRFCCAEFVNVRSQFARKLNGRVVFDPLRVLITAMVRARSVCRLKYLTGGSVVAYGIPCINMPETVSWARTFTQKVVLRFLYIYSGCNVFSTYVGGVVFLSGDSMQPTIHGGDVVATRAFRPRVHKVEKGQIVCVKSPTDPGLLVCKRVAALEHERVGEVVIEGHSTNPRVAKGHVFLLGDNLEASTDSRQYGPVPMGLIHSQVVFRIWPPHRVGWLNASA